MKSVPLQVYFPNRSIRISGYSRALRLVAANASASYRAQTFITNKTFSKHQLANYLKQIYLTKTKTAIKLNANSNSKKSALHGLLAANLNLTSSSAVIKLENSFTSIRLHKTAKLIWRVSKGQFTTIFNKNNLRSIELLNSHVVTNRHNAKQNSLNVVNASVIRNVPLLDTNLSLIKQIGIDLMQQKYSWAEKRSTNVWDIIKNSLFIQYMLQYPVIKEIVRQVAAPRVQNFAMKVGYIHSNKRFANVRKLILYRKRFKTKSIESKFQVELFRADYKN